MKWCGCVPCGRRRRRGSRRSSGRRLPAVPSPCLGGSELEESSSSFGSSWLGSYGDLCGQADGALPEYERGAEAAADAATCAAAAIVSFPAGEHVDHGGQATLKYNDQHVRLCENDSQNNNLPALPHSTADGVDSVMKDDGTHLWKLRRFKRAAMCNVCLQALVAWGGKQGLSCTLCKYTVHERCVPRAPHNCISTYVKSRRAGGAMSHHWVEGNCNERCAKCAKWVRTFDAGRRCRWCQTTLHAKCAAQWKADCDLGPLAYHILPPTAICPAVLERPSFRSSRGDSFISGDGTPIPGCTASSERPPFDRAASAATPPLTPLGSASGQLGANASSSAQSNSFQISPPPNTKPLLVFINPKSGGKQGERIYRKFQYMLNPRQVYNLSNGGPKEGLKMFYGVPNVNILCCGGDGTVGWVLDAMDKMYTDGDTAGRPPVAVLPLGTGNDLARCLHWGGGYEGESLTNILKRVQRSKEVMLDRWQISLTDVDQSQQADPLPANVINNYFSIGVDASIAHRFHTMRERHPEKFNSRTKNKLWYFEFGTGETLAGTCKNLHDEVEIICDGVPLELPAGTVLEGIAVLNIHSIYGGSDLWGDKRSRRYRLLSGLQTGSLSHGAPGGHKKSDVSSGIQDIGDKLIEIVGLESAMAVGQIKAGLRASGHRLAQCSSVTIRTRKAYPMQVDGEPWMQPACTINITHKNHGLGLPLWYAAKCNALHCAVGALFNPQSVAPY